MKRVAIILAVGVAAAVCWAIHKNSPIFIKQPIIAVAKTVWTGTNEEIHLLLKNPNPGVYLVEISSQNGLAITNIDLEPMGEERMIVPLRTSESADHLKVLARRQLPDQMRSWDEFLIHLGLKRRHFVIYTRDVTEVSVTKTNREP